MNKDLIEKTAVLSWSDEEGEFIVESPLFDSAAGIGETPEEAWKIFRDLLDGAYLSYLEGRVGGYDRPGRPAKGGVSFNTDVKPATKEAIGDLAKEIGCTFGELVDYVVAFYQGNRSLPQCIPTSSPPEESLSVAERDPRKRPSSKRGKFALPLETSGSITCEENTGKYRTEYILLPAKPFEDRLTAIETELARLRKSKK